MDDADGEKGFCAENRSSDEKKAEHSDVGDSLSDDGGDGESPVDPPSAIGRLKARQAASEMEPV